MKVKEFCQIMEIVRQNKPSRLEIINLMYAMQRALSDKTITNEELFTYFQGWQDLPNKKG